MKLIFVLVGISALIFMAVSCAIVDWTPVVLYVQVQDEAGNDLLDPDNGNEWLAGTTITHAGIVVDLDLSPETKTVAAFYQGFRVVQYKGGYALSFGEFSGENEYDDAEFYLSWPDGKSDVISYTRKLNRMAVTAKEKWTLNGRECSNPVLIVNYPPPLNARQEEYHAFLNSMSGRIIGLSFHLPELPQPSFSSS